VAGFVYCSVFRNKKELGLGELVRKSNLELGIIYIAQFHRNFWWVEHVRRKSTKHSAGMYRNLMAQLKNFRKTILN